MRDRLPNETPVPPENWIVVRSISGSEQREFEPSDSYRRRFSKMRLVSAVAMDPEYAERIALKSACFSGMYK